MPGKIKKALNYLGFMLLANTTYGIILYFLVTWLAGYSLLLAYAGNIALILLVLGYDEFAMRKLLRAEKIYALIRISSNAKERALSIRLYRWGLKYYVSFKTFLFTFYIAVVVFSQIIRFRPELVGEEFTTFIGIIDYGVLMLLAFKDFREEFAKDSDRSKARLAEFEKYLEEHPEL